LSDPVTIVAVLFEHRTSTQSGSTTRCAPIDLSDRYQALEHKLRSVQEALELVLDMARDYRLVLLEVTIVVLFLVEIMLSFGRHEAI
jgi:uncharacterized Rmd1/YagE family protein